MLYSADQRVVVRPFTAADNQEHGELWTPVVAGDHIVIELTVKRLVRSQVKLVLGQVGSGYRGFGASLPLGNPTQPSGSCNNDVVCPEGVPWANEIPAIGAISTGGSIFCTGFMVNNTAGDRTPYFMTANHCGIRSSNASSLVVYWNFQVTTCGGPRNGSLSTFQSGSTFLASYSASDFTLVRLNGNPQPAWGITYAGWSRSTGNASSAVAIHHPSGDEKAISFENQSTSTTSYLGTSVPGDGTHVRITDWDDGTTEPGSSGSPLFDQNHRVIGQLHGGYAACGNNSSDWYGRFSVSWAGGGSNSTRLSNWLDPGNTGATFVDTLTSGGGGGPPVNDECSLALPLANGVNGPFSNTNATDSTPAFSCSTGPDADVWFTYVASCTGSATIETCGAGTNFDTKLEVLSGACGNLAPIACNDDSCSLQSSVTFNTTAGVIYRVRVGGFQGAEGDFTLTVTCTGVPGNNDDCAGAIPVVDGANGPYDNQSATTSSPSWPCGGSAANDVWFSYLATCTGTLTVDTCGSGFDTKIQAFSGSCASLTSLACNDDTCGLQSTVTFSTTIGVTYLLRVGGYNGAQGTFTLNIACTGSGIPNDDCAGAIALTSGVNGPYSNVGATLSQPFACGSGVGADLWFRYVPSCGAVTFDTCSGTTFDTVLEVFSGSCGSLTQLGCNDDTCGLQSSVTINVNPGATYFVHVGGYSGATGSFSLNVTEGVGQGSFSTVATGCGVIDLQPSGSAAIGGSVSFTVTGATGASYLWIGNQTSIPLCSGCTLGAELGIVVPATSITFPIPCDPVLRGGQIATQAGDLGGLGGCANPPLSVSPTVVTTVG